MLIATIAVFGMTLPVGAFAIALIAGLGIWVTPKNRHTTQRMTMAVVAVILEVAYLSTVGFIVLSQRSDYRDCVYQVTRSAGNREQWEAVIGELRDAHLPDAAGRLQVSLDLNLPERSMSQCDHLK